nr:hypothetical protein Iba_chr11bCG12190 [Ipomoea batatas]
MCNLLLIDLFYIAYHIYFQIPIHIDMEFQLLFITYLYNNILVLFFSATIAECLGHYAKKLRSSGQLPARPVWALTERPLSHRAGATDPRHCQQSQTADHHLPTRNHSRRLGVNAGEKFDHANKRAEHAVIRSESLGNGHRSADATANEKVVWPVRDTATPPIREAPTERGCLGLAESKHSLQDPHGRRRLTLADAAVASLVSLRQRRASTDVLDKLEQTLASEKGENLSPPNTCSSWKDNFKTQVMRRIQRR